MVGPFKTARGSITHLLVAGDKFTKWIKAKPIKKLNGPTTVTFIADITVRYGVSHSIITDNDTNFAKGALAHFCTNQGIRLDLAFVAHPQSNGQGTNRSTSFTPFFLMYGAEAIIPMDIEFDLPRITMYTDAEAKEVREDGVDQLEEAQLLACIRSAIYQ